MQKISYESFREWRMESGLTLKDLGEVVGVKNLSYYTAHRKPFKIEWLLAWQQEYGWSDDQLFRYAFGRLK